MALTEKQKEYRKNKYDCRKNNGLCVKCGIKLYTDQTICNECIDKGKVQAKDRYYRLKEGRICTQCGKMEAKKYSILCIECSRRDNKRSREEGKKRYYERKAKGLCTRCGCRSVLSGRTECDVCMEKHSRLYYARVGKIKDYSRKKGVKNRALWWNQVLDHYGAMCACCGETELMFLTIDHINNDGYQHRIPSGGRMKTAKLYRWLVLNDFPEGYQILCWNCNCGKHRNKGTCPHQSKREVM